MNKEEIFQYLTENKIPYECLEHKAVYNMEDIKTINLPHPEAEAKNLFLRDDKKRNYYLITIKGEKHVDLDKFRRQNNTRRLSFASDQDLSAILGLHPGAVTPFGILNDTERKVIFILDNAFFTNSGLVAVHPNDNTATVWLKADDLLKIITDHGNNAYIVKIDY